MHKIKKKEEKGNYMSKSATNLNKMLFTYR